MGQEELRNEFWPEIDLFYRVDAIHRFVFLTAPAMSPKDNYSEGLIGLHFESGLFRILRSSTLPTHDIDRFRYRRLRVGVQHLAIPCGPPAVGCRFRSHHSSSTTQASIRDSGMPAMNRDGLERSRPLSLS